MGVSPMSLPAEALAKVGTTGILPVGFPRHGRAKTAPRLMARMAMPRREGVGVLIVVVYLPPAGKRDFFQPGVFRGTAVQAIAPRVGDVGVRVAGGAVGAAPPGYFGICPTGFTFYNTFRLR